MTKEPTLKAKAACGGGDAQLRPKPEGVWAADPEVSVGLRELIITNN